MWTPCGTGLRELLADLGVEARADLGVEACADLEAGAAHVRGRVPHLDAVADAVVAGAPDVVDR